MKRLAWAALLLTMPATAEPVALSWLHRDDDGKLAAFRGA